MKRYNNLYPQIYDFNNIYQAYLNTRKHKRYKKEALRFSLNLEEQLILLQNELIWKCYLPLSYKNFYINDPKKRLIMAPAFRDRVLHHAICNIITPLFEKKFIYDSYACRKGKGTHKGVNRLSSFLRKSSRKWTKVYCLKCDIQSYYPSVPHANLKTIIRKTIKCKNTLWLLDAIIDSISNEKGIPLGNLTSQLFANIYLNDMDHFIKEQLNIKYYLRYMDDFIILYNNKKMLKQIWLEIKEFLFPKELILNSKTSIFPVTQGIDFLGYRIWPTHRLLRKSSIRRAKRKFKSFSNKYKKNKISIQKVKQSLMSWLGHARHCDSYNVKLKVLNSLILQK